MCLCVCVYFNFYIREQLEILTIIDSVKVVHICIVHAFSCIRYIEYIDDVFYAYAMK